MKHIVYFYSGTGNSLAVAKELEKTGAEVRSIAYEYQKMLKEEKKSITCEAYKIGFVLPTYFLGLTRIVHDFMKAVEIKNAGYIYVVATMGWSIRGGISRIFYT